MRQSTVKRPQRQVVRLRDTVIPFGKYKGFTFEQMLDVEGGLSYLDWLAGQWWVYGEFEKRLYAFLKNFNVQRMLNELFPDRDITTMPWDSLGLFGHWDKDKFVPGPKSQWHGQDMPKGEEEPRDWQPRPLRPVQAWGIIIDFLLTIEESNDPSDLLDLDFESLKKAMPLMSKDVQTKVRKAYHDYRAMMRSRSLYPDEIWVRADLLSDALQEMALLQ